MLNDAWCGPAVISRATASGASLPSAVRCTRCMLGTGTSQHRVLVTSASIGHPRPRLHPERARFAVLNSKVWCSLQTGEPCPRVQRVIHPVRTLLVSECSTSHLEGGD